MDGAMSSTQRNSKRVEMRPLAGVETGQHQQCSCTMVHVPQPSALPPCYARLLSDHMNPLCQCRQLKTRPRQVSQIQSRRSTHHVKQSCQDQIGQVGSLKYTQYICMVEDTYEGYLPVLDAAEPRSRDPA